MKQSSNDEFPSEVKLRALDIVQREEKKFLSRAARMVYGRQAAHDVVQELRVQILASNTLPTENERLTRYLFGMLVKVADKWRTRNLDSRIEHCGSLDTGRLQERLSQLASVDADYGPVDVDFRNALLKRLAEDLPPKCKAGFIKVLTKRMTNVTAKPDDTAATEESHYQRAVKKLRRKIVPGGNS